MGLPDITRSRYVCSKCLEGDISLPARAKWDVQRQEFYLCAVQAGRPGHCEKCKTETAVIVKVARDKS